MAIYKRGKVIWFKFVRNGQMIRESTKPATASSPDLDRHRLALRKLCVKHAILVCSTHEITAAIIRDQAGNRTRWGSDALSERDRV